MCTCRSAQTRAHNKKNVTDVELFNEIHQEKQSTSEVKMSLVAKTGADSPITYNQKLVNKYRWINS